MKLRWSTPAADELEAAHNYYVERNPEAARRIAERIVDATQQMLEQPFLGRPAPHPDHREWVVDKTPYVIVYRVGDDAVEILHVWHGAQNRQDSDP